MAEAALENCSRVFPTAITEAGGDLKQSVEREQQGSSSVPDELSSNERAFITFSPVDPRVF